MTELEELVRADLHRAADGVGIDLDMAAVLSRGRRARRAQSLRRGMGVAAGVAILGLAGWALIVPRTVPGVPEPAQTATGNSTTKASATIDLSEGFTMNGTASPYSSLAVTVEREGVGYTASFEVTTVDGNTYKQTGRVAAGRALLHQFPRLSVALIADLPSWRQSVYRPAIAGGVTSREVALPTLGVTVAVDLAEDADAQIAGLVWQDSEGALRNDRGEELVSKEMGVATGVDELYYDERLSALFFRPAGADLISDALGGHTSIMRIGTVWKSASGYQYAEAGLLPEGAKNPLLTPAKHGTDYTIGKLDGSGRVVLILHGKASSDGKGRLLNKLAYIDAKGRRVVDTNPYG